MNEEELPESKAGKVIFAPDNNSGYDLDKLGHGLHEPSPERFVVSELHLPSGQLMQHVEPGAAEYVFATQCRHADELLAPSKDEYVPARQLVHTCELFASSADE